MMLMIVSMKVVTLLWVFVCEHLLHVESFQLIFIEYCSLYAIQLWVQEVGVRVATGQSHWQ